MTSEKLELGVITSPGDSPDQAMADVAGPQQIADIKRAMELLDPLL